MTCRTGQRNRASPNKIRNSKQLLVVALRPFLIPTHAVPLNFKLCQNSIRARVGGHLQNGTDAGQTWIDGKMAETLGNPAQIFGKQPATEIEESIITQEKYRHKAGFDHK